MFDAVTQSGKDSVRDARAIAEAAALAGARVIAEAGLQVGTVTRKGAVDLVTAVDLASEAAVRAVLEARAPGVPVLAEEGGGAASARTRWIVDPLDGTTNFVHGFPHYAVSVALEVDGALLAGAIVDPRTMAVASAGRGCGSTLNGQRLAVSSVDSLDEALFLTGFAYDRRERPDFYLARVRRALVAGQGLRRCGAATHDFLHIACGRADVYWEYNLGPWDVAAGVLLVEEAGGKVTDLRGLPVEVGRPEILATNARLHDAALDLLGPPV